MQQMPQEIEVWYVLPAIRKELARELVKLPGVSQKNAAAILGVTEPAISQYVNNKRGGEEKYFDKAIKLKIKKAAKNLLDNGDAITEINNLCDEIRKKEILCKIHKDFDKNISGKCKVCLPK